MMTEEEKRELVMELLQGTVVDTEKSLAVVVESMPEGEGREVFRRSASSVIDQLNIILVEFGAGSKSSIEAFDDALAVINSGPVAIINPEEVFVFQDIRMQLLSKLQEVDHAQPG